MPSITSPIIIDKVTAAAQLDSARKPVIFWDTCALLDIIRLPLPNRGNAATLKKTLEIKNKIISGDIISLSSEMCISEFNRHIPHLTVEVDNEAKRIAKQANHFFEFINILSPGVFLAPLDLTIYKLDELLAQVAQAIIQKTKFIEEHTTFADFAHTRIKFRIPPAQVKGEYKDCYIWGTCLEVRQLCADKSYEYNFFSSNTLDYAEANKKDLQSQLKHDASTNNIGYFPDFSIAHGLLTSRGVL